MNILDRIAALDKTERYVFMSELHEKGLTDDLLRYIAGVSDADAEKFLSVFSRVERDHVMSELERFRPVTASSMEASGLLLEDTLNRMDGLKEHYESISRQAENQISINRDFMKEWLTREKPVSDQSLEKPCPPVQKMPAIDAKITPLPPAVRETLLRNDLFSLIRDRKSHRKFTDEALTLDELSFLLWSTQGVKKVLGSGVATIRTVPSAGARHPFETYIAINNVTGLKPGMYHYLPVEHAVEFMFDDKDMEAQLIECGVGQRFVGECAACFFWSCIPYRGEWRYTTASHKNMLLDAGHVCQNLYLACEAIACGTCAIGAYHQGKTDAYLRLDGYEEFVVYLSPVGKVKTP
jgi:SagB-type dehydrogenase family enzyme